MEAGTAQPTRTPQSSQTIPLADVLLHPLLMVIQAGTEGGTRVAEVPPAVLPRVGAMSDKGESAGDVPSAYIEWGRSSFSFRFFFVDAVTAVTALATILGTTCTSLD